MTCIKENEALFLLRAGIKIEIGFGINPGYGLGCGLCYGAKAMEHGEVTHTACGATVELAIRYLLDFHLKIAELIESEKRANGK